MTHNDFPALTGGVVTEAHARVCRERGHATHTVDGVASGVCPRCGEVVGGGSTVDPYEAAFERGRALGMDHGEAAALAGEVVRACRLRGSILPGDK